LTTAGLNVTGAVTVNSAGSVTLATSQRLTGLTIGTGGSVVMTTTGGAAAPKAMFTAGLSMAGTARLDLADNCLVVDYAGAASPIAAVRAAILAGRGASATGRWLNPGIGSSAAALDADAYGIGYAPAADVLIFVAGFSTFGGEMVDTTAVLARYTLLGDGTLDGACDFNDLVLLAQNYNTTIATPDGWSRGDYTYDGACDFNDLVKLAQNYNGSLTAAQAIPGAPVGFEQDLAAAFASVPEPGAASALLIATWGLACRPRPRRRP
jgi:hypothetical protein